MDPKLTPDLPILLSDIKARWARGCPCNLNILLVWTGEKFAKDCMMSTTETPKKSPRE